MRYGGQQFAGVLLLRIEEDFVGVAVFDNPARLHHRNAIGEVADDGQVMGDEEHGQAEVGLQATQEIEDLGLDRNVERGHRFIGNDDARLRGQ